MANNVDDRVRAQVQGKAVYWFDPEGSEPNPILMLYAYPNRAIRMVAPQEIEQLQKINEPFILVAPIANGLPANDMVEQERLLALGVSFWTYAPQPISDESGHPLEPDEQSTEALREGA